MARRLFLAIPLPDTVTAAVVAACRTLDRRCPRVRWTREENLHATVLFMGNVEDVTLEKLLPRFRDAFRDICPFSLEATGFVPGPSRRAASMLWLGFRESDDFAGLARVVHDIASGELDLPPPKETPAPHVTLARGRNGVPGHCIEAARRVGSVGSFTVSGCILYESLLSPDGPTYTKRDSLSFGGQ